MAEHLYIVGGSKGGVGKSIVSMTLIDHLRKLDKKVVLIEFGHLEPRCLEGLQWAREIRTCESRQEGRMDGAGRHLR